MTDAKLAPVIIANCTTGAVEVRHDPDAVQALRASLVADEAERVAAAETRAADLTQLQARAADDPTFAALLRVLGLAA